MPKPMKISVELKDMGTFKEVLNIIKDITEDPRVPSEIKIEVKEKINNITQKLESKS